jgi:hypothetical protein
MILGIDFDGTIVEHRFPNIGAEAPGAFLWLKRFQELGAKLILNTMRSDNRSDGKNYLQDAIDFCKGNGVEFWGANKNPDQSSWTTSPKVYAHAYIDDLSIGCPMIAHPASGLPVVNWAVVGPIVEQKIMAMKAKGSGAH